MRGGPGGGRPESEASLRVKARLERQRLAALGRERGFYEYRGEVDRIAAVDEEIAASRRRLRALPGGEEQAVVRPPEEAVPAPHEAAVAPERETRERRATPRRRAKPKRQSAPRPAAPPEEESA